MKLNNEFFARDPKIVALSMIGRYLVRRLDDEMYHFEIIETGAYSGIARKFGKEFTYLPGSVYLHSAQGKSKVLAISTMAENFPSVVTVRKVISSKPFQEVKYRSIIDGPGKLTKLLKIGEEFNGFSIEGEKLWIEGDAIDSSWVMHIKPTEEKMSDNCLDYYRLKPFAN